MIPERFTLAWGLARKPVLLFVWIELAARHESG